MVNISQIEPMGTYALRLLFDDGHDTGIYSWSTLHALGTNYEQNWADYLQELKYHYLSRDKDNRVLTDGVKTTVKLLYFIQFANITGTDQEEVELPEAVNNVAGLLAWIRERGKNWYEAFADNKVQVTIRILPSLILRWRTGTKWLGCRSLNKCKLNNKCS